jgi:uncharacterized protein YjbI with pentapeptide repeats
MAGSDRSRMMRTVRALRRRAAEPPLAAKANDLESLKKAVEDAAGIGAGQWLSYLFVLFYIALAAGAVTHADLLLENPVKLPFLSIELPLKAFFFLAPILFIITHAYTLVHFVLLAKKAGRFHNQLYAQIPGEENQNPTAAEKREGLRGQLPSNIFVQFLAGPRDIRESWLGVLLKLIAWATLVIGPVALLLLLQIQFLPYHESWISWTQRIALLLDLLLVWWLWRSILSGRDDFHRWRAWKSWAAPALGIISSVAVVIFSWTVATYPGEWQKRPLVWVASINPRSLNSLLFIGEVDYDTTHRRKSWFSSTLVLPGLNIYEALRIDEPKKVEWRDHILDLRGRDLEGAVLVKATLRKVDFTGACLRDTLLFRAQLQGASFLRAKLQGAWLDSAQLQGAWLEEAKLQGASLFGAQLQGAMLDNAQLQGASVNSAQLQGASLNSAHLQGALLFRAQLQGASLFRAQLQGASLNSAQLQGASLDRAQLQGAMLFGAQLQGASLAEAQLQGASLSGANMTATSLTKAFVWRVEFPKDGPMSLFAVDLNWRPRGPGWP